MCALKPDIISYQDVMNRDDKIRGSSTHLLHKKSVAAASVPCPGLGRILIRTQVLSSRLINSTSLALRGPGEVRLNAPILSPTVVESKGIIFTCCRKLKHQELALIAAQPHNLENVHDTDRFCSSHRIYRTSQRSWLFPHRQRPPLELRVSSLVISLSR